MFRAPKGEAIHGEEGIGREGDSRDPVEDPPTVSAEEKIRIVIERLRGEESIASLCRREGIAANLYYPPRGPRRGLT